MSSPSSPPPPPPPPPSYFQSLPDDTVTHIVRYLSRYPQHTLWYCYFNTSTFFRMIKCVNELSFAIRNLFDGITSQPEQLQIPDPHPEDVIYTRIPLTTYNEARNLIECVEFLQLRSLVLTPQFTMYLRESNTFLITCSKTVIDLTLNHFHDEDSVTIGKLLDYLGENLLSFEANDSSQSMIQHIHDYCKSLKSLTLSLTTTLNHHENSTTTTVTLSSVGDWHQIGHTLEHLTLKYQDKCCQSDSELVRSTFRGLRELNILIRDESQAIDGPNYETVVKYFGGIGKHNLERANLGNMPARLISRIRSFYPSTKLQIHATGTSIAAQIDASGDNLTIANLCSDMNMNFQVQNSFANTIEKSMLNCCKLEKISVQRHVCDFGEILIRVAKLSRLRLLYLNLSNPVVLSCLIGRTGALQSIYYKGKTPNAKVLRQLANENNRLQRVHLAIRARNVNSVKHVLQAFSNCEQLRQLFVDSLTVWNNEKLACLNNVMGRYYIRHAHVRVDDTVLIL